MKFVLLILITAYVICLSYQSKYFVITKYNTEELEDYYEHLRNAFGSDYIRKQFENSELKQSKLCHKLRKSKIFSVGNSSSEYLDRVSYIYAESKIHAEYEQLIPSALEVQTKEHNKKTVQKLPAFNCLDYKGDFGWIITKGFHENSYFMFSYGASFQFTTARQTGVQRRPPPKLVGLIDGDVTEEPHTFPNCTGLNPFHLEEIINNPSSSDRDVLCDLHPLLKYRLCSLGGDFIKRDFMLILGDDDSYPQDEQHYMNIVSNLISPFTNSTSDCARPKLKPRYGFRRNATFPRKALKCSVVLQDPFETKSYVFYLAQNTLDKSTAYVYSKNLEEQDKCLKKIRISWLDHLPEYIRAFTNSR